jgi:hypothetical protein
MAKSFIFYPRWARRRSGTRTFSKTQRFGLTPEGWTQRFEPLLCNRLPRVKSVIEKFREKYGAKDVKRYHSKFDVAVIIEMGVIEAPNRV